MRLPPKSKRPGHESYPMPNEQHVAAALGFAKMHHPGDTGLMSRLRAKARSKGFGSSVAQKRYGGLVEGHKAKHRLDRKGR